MRIDLHCHSTASDGTEPPAEVIRRALGAGVSVLALTDHDTVAGYAAAAAVRPAGMTLLKGIELSCRRGERSLHLLGYLFDAGEPELAAELEKIRTDRLRRARAMVERLAELGVPITWEQVGRIASGPVRAAPGRADHGGAVGRPHIARALIELGVVGSIEEAFSRHWIGSGGRAYVDRYAVDPRRGVELIRRAGGVCVLAHSRRRGYVSGDTEIAELAAAGLTGIEVDHPGHDAAGRAGLRGLAAELRLVMTGASDDHGELTGHRLGCETTMAPAYEALVAEASGAVPDRG